MAIVYSPRRQCQTAHVHARWCARCLDSELNTSWADLRYGEFLAELVYRSGSVRLESLIGELGGLESARGATMRLQAEKRRSQHIPAQSLASPA